MRLSLVYLCLTWIIHHGNKGLNLEYWTFLFPCNCFLLINPWPSFWISPGLGVLAAVVLLLHNVMAQDLFLSLRQGSVQTWLSKDAWSVIDTIYLQPKTEPLSHRATGSLMWQWEDLVTFTDMVMLPSMSDKWSVSMKEKIESFKGMGVLLVKGWMEAGVEQVGQLFQIASENEGLYSPRDHNDFKIYIGYYSGYL